MAKHKQPMQSVRPLKDAPSVDKGGSLPVIEPIVDVPRETVLPQIESPPTHGFYITVIHPFGQHKKGDRVRSYHDIQKIIDTGHLRFCSKTVV